MVIPYKLFVGRVNEVSLLERAFNPTGMPHRSILFIIGPTGIGKTATAHYALEKLREREVIGIFLDFSKVYANLSEAISDIIKQFENQSKEYEDILKRFIKWLSEFKKVIRSIQLGPLGMELRRNEHLRTSPIKVFQDTVSNFVDSIREVGAKAVIVIDELQNLLSLSDWSPWGLMKFLMSLQEYYGSLQFTLISSDYSFRAKVISNSQIEFIDTFYLGEMIYEDALELLKKVLRLNKSFTPSNTECKEVLDLIGGNPALIYRLADHSLKYGAPLNEALNYLRRHIYEDTLRKITLLKQRREWMNKWPYIMDLIKKLYSGPVDVYDVGIELIDYIDSLVKLNILQYGCREYVGIYEWNRGSSGGLCGLEVIAPSNRLYLDALRRIIKSSVK